MRQLPHYLPSALWQYALTTTLLLTHLLPGTAMAQTVSDAPTESEVEASAFLLNNTARYRYLRERNSNDSIQGFTNSLDTALNNSLLDPRGQILGCGGELLNDYTGFSVALFEPDPADPTGTDLGNLLSLTPTELPNRLDNNIPAGIDPNRTNINPFPLSNRSQGQYSFLLDPNRGQLEIGSTYILMVNVPEGSVYNQRRVRLEITDIVPTDNRNIVTYEATSLDGLPITAEGQEQLELAETTIIADAERISLQLLAIQFAGALCPASPVQITKIGDRANAAAGDTILYRLSVRNTSDAAIDNTVITDVLPMGFKFLDNAVRGEVGGEIVPVTVERTGMVVTFSTPVTLAPDAVLNIVYGAQLTPDAIRGNGENTATVAAQRVDNDLDVRDGPAVHRVRVTPGIVSDCGTILGRVFVDKNFDGEQQPGEPGVPNSVIFMDDGNRITTDEDGLFHLKCVLPGQRVGALDLTSLPGYTIAPNPYFIERNSPSRLVRLAPGGLVRMNFGVTPTFQEGAVTPAQSEKPSASESRGKSE